MDRDVSSTTDIFQGDYIVGTCDAGTYEGLVVAQNPTKLCVQVYEDGTAQDDEFVWLDREQAKLHPEGRAISDEDDGELV